MKRISSELHDAYVAKFGLPVPLGRWHSEADWTRAEEEVKKALAGKRGRLEEEEFELPDEDEGVVL